MKNEEMYYVYAYLDPRKFGSFKYGVYCFRHEPFYIGKGKAKRMYQHLKEAKLNNLSINPHKVRKIQKIMSSGFLPIVCKLGFYSEEKDAYASEYDLIQTIGRVCNKTGPLTNIQEGGDGGDTRSFLSEEKKAEIRNKYRNTLKEKKKQGLYSPPVKKFGEENPMYGKGGCVGMWKSKVASGEWTQEQYDQKYEDWIRKICKPLSDETKFKISASLGHYYSEHRGKSRYGEENSFFGKSHTEETRQKLSESHRGRKFSDETRRKMSESRKGVKRSNVKKLYGEENPMHGRSFKDVWKARLMSGEWTQEQYDQRLEDYRSRCSKAHAGKSLSEAAKKKISSSKKDYYKTNTVWNKNLKTQKDSNLEE